MTDNVLVYDCFSGLSGDMHIGAMLDIGVPEQYLRDQLGRLAMADEFELQIKQADKLGITGTQATVVMRQTPHHHRHLKDIAAIIQDANLPADVAAQALAIFEHIAIAEAHVHGTSVDEVHFHEVGATDSIADIVAAAICLDYLNVDQVFCSNLELGGGMVRCAHGLMPVPAPATAEILKGISCRYGGIDQEATTPTGAAILKHAVTSFSAPSGFQASRVGYGLGQKDFTIPNVVRVMLGTIDSDKQQAHSADAPVSFYQRERNLQIECNIDDMSPEAFQPLMNALFEAGAKDVFMTPIIMKKTRPGTRLTTLCSEDTLKQMLALIFQQSTSIGVRVQSVEKYMLPREQHDVQTSLGTVRVKLVHLADGSSRWKLEHDQVMTLAQSAGQDYLSTWNQLNTEVNAELSTNSSGR
jgi:uncharacterized protein (TIGR00299 family) protein